MKRHPASNHDNRRNHIIDLADKLIVDFMEVNDERDDIPSDRCFRAYKSSPEGATIQIRHVAPLTKTQSRSRSKAKPRRFMASVSYVTVDQLDEMIEALTAVRNQIQPQ